jgi:hydrogenase assembly chaperone HypC/HupF
MCLTLPFKIKKISGDRAELSDGRSVNIAMVEKPKVGDWVLANADLAVAKVSQKEAEEIKNYLK